MVLKMRVEGRERGFCEVLLGCEIVEETGFCMFRGMGTCRRCWKYQASLFA